MRKITNEELHRPSVEEFAAMPKLPLVVVLDNVRSAQNVGSFFRTGDAFAVERIALCGITAVPPCRELHKTALGAEQSVAWTHHASTVECIDELRAAGYRVLAVEQVEGAAMLDALAVDPRSSSATRSKGCRRRRSTAATARWRSPSWAPNIRSTFRCRAGSFCGNSFAGFAQKRNFAGEKPPTRPESPRRIMSKY